MEPIKILTAQPSTSSPSNFTGECSMAKTPKTYIKSEANESMVDNSSDEKPLDLSMKKPSKPIYVLDSEEEGEIITIDSDDDDNKEHLQKSLFKF